MHPQEKDSLQAGREHTGSCPSQGCALSQRKTQMVAAGARGRTGTPTSGTPWSRALGGAATQASGMMPEPRPHSPVARALGTPLRLGSFLWMH